MQNRNRYNANKKGLNLIVGLFGFCVMFLCSCDSLTANQIGGSYSYKTSGIVSITENSVTTDTSLDNIIGTLDVKPQKGDSVMLIFNEVNGDVVTIQARVKGDSILMPTFQKVYSITTTSSSSIFQTTSSTISKYLVSLSGYGIVMDETLLFTYRIVSGKALQSGKSQVIRSNNIKTVAKKNN